MKKIHFFCLAFLATKAFAQFQPPQEDLIQGKECTWVPMQGYNTSGVCGNPFIYYNDHYLIYHYETQKLQHSIYFLITKKTGKPDFTFCGDSCVVINCYDSAMSDYAQKKGGLDKVMPVATITVNYGGGDKTTYGDGKEIVHHYITVDINNHNALGSFKTTSLKSGKALIKTILPKIKKVEYETNLMDGVAFTHTTFNWSQLRFEANGYTVNFQNAQKDSLALVQRKRYLDSLLRVEQ